MKIIKHTSEIAVEQERERKANRGCNICPCCGETMSFSETVKKGLVFKRGISSIVLSTPVKTGWFSSKYMTVRRYRCYRCKAEWESDPY